MNRHFALIRAVFVKDVLLLWPLALLSVAMILTRHLLVTDFDLIRFFLPMMAALVPAIFLLGLIHQDAPASLRHDWLTRPVGARHVLIAKTVLVALVVLVPAVLGPVLAAVRDGTDLSEALLTALTGVQLYIASGFFLLLVAALTTTLLQASGILLGLFLLFALVPPFLLPISGLSEGVMVLGSGWVVVSIFELVFVVAGIAVLWLQYAARSTGGARGALGGMIAVFGLLMAFLGWNAVYSVQSLATRGAAPEGFAIVNAHDCFDAKTLEPLPEDGPPPPDMVWGGDELKRAGPGPIGFWTAIRSQGLPAGWRLSPGYLRGRFVDTQGKTLAPIEPSRFTTAWRSTSAGIEARNPWLLSRAQFDSLKDRARGLMLDYELNLLAPVYSGAIAVDGKPHPIGGLGSCTASKRGPSMLVVSCFKAGLQPQLLTAWPLGTTADREVAFSAANFAPALLRHNPGVRQTLSIKLLPSFTPTHVRVTQYEARAHITRSVTAPGLPGAPASACPAPAPDMGGAGAH